MAVIPNVKFINWNRIANLSFAGSILLQYTRKRESSHSAAIVSPPTG